MTYHQPKIPKTQLPDKSLYTQHIIKEHIGLNRNWNQGYYRIVSIDPGRKNLAIRIETRSYDSKTVYTEVLEKYDIEDYICDDINVGKETYIYDTINEILNYYMPLILQSHFIIIERQMTINYRMVRISQAIISFFLLMLKSAIYGPLIYEVSSKLKTKMLDAPKGLNPKDTKKWAVDLALLILQFRGDSESYTKIQNAPASKKDDYSDVVVQIEALFKYLGLSTTFDYMNITVTSSKFSLSANIPP